jgi:hypothetical protein
VAFQRCRSETPGQAGNAATTRAKRLAPSVWPVWGSGARIGRPERQTRRNNIVVHMATDDLAWLRWQGGGKCKVSRLSPRPFALETSPPSATRRPYRLPALRPPEPSKVASWMMTRPGALSADDQASLDAILTASPELAAFTEDSLFLGQPQVQHDKGIPRRPLGAKPADEVLAHAMHEETS